MAELPRLYTDLADWFHLLTDPAEYAEEAAFYMQTLTAASSQPPRTLLELGSGGGNNAWHYKRQLQATLVDASPAMIALSQRLNPECEHLVGDMRSIRIRREFDLVFVHDAVDYLTTTADLSEAMRTAFVHLRPGGVALFAPDHLRETFSPSTEHGGHDGEGRALRYLQWSWDPDPDDTTYQVDYAYILRETGQPTRSIHDIHLNGLFSASDWLRLMGQAGFGTTMLPFEHSEEPSGTLHVFVGVKPLV